jgi:hypothetical protein
MELVIRLDDVILCAIQVIAGIVPVQETPSSYILNHG